MDSSRTSASPRFGFDLSSSMYLRTSGPPSCLTRMACIALATLAIANREINSSRKLIANAAVDAVHVTHEKVGIDGLHQNEFHYRSEIFVLDALREVGISADDDHRQVIAVVANEAGDLHAVRRRDVEIEQHAAVVAVQTRKKTDGLLPVLRDIGFHSPALKRDGDRPPDGRFVVDDQDTMDAIAGHWQ